MPIKCTGHAKIKHAKTGKVYTIDCAEIEWNPVESSGRQMGKEVRHEGTFEHPDLGTLTWHLWEYPEGVVNHFEAETGSHEVLEDCDCFL